MSLTGELKASPPGLHGQAEFWGLAWEALAFIEETVQPGMATIETGAGASGVSSFWGVSRGSPKISLEEAW